MSYLDHPEIVAFCNSEEWQRERSLSSTMGMILSLRDKLMRVKRNSHMLNTILTVSCVSFKLSKLGTLMGLPQKNENNSGND